MNESDLTPGEKKIWDLKDEALSLVGVENRINEVRISETMRSLEDGWKAEGLWESENRRIIVKRSALSSRSRFVVLLLHEAAHAKRGATDQTREFEGDLTDFLGITGTAAVEGTEQVPEKDINPVSRSD